MRYVSDTIFYPQVDKANHGYRIYLPQYHRAAVGIFPGTQIFMVPISRSNELILCSIDPASWGDLWRLDIGLKDYPGAARSVVETLVSNNVNILLEEGLSDYYDDNEIRHRVYLVLDLAGYRDDTDDGTDHRNSVTRTAYRPSNLITSIIEGSRKFLRPTLAEDRWDLSFERMDFFHRHKGHRHRAEGGGSQDRSIRYADKDYLFVTEAVVQKVYSGRMPTQVACHITSDTEEKYVKIRFLDDRVKYILFEIKHKDQVGSILSITEVLRDFDLNIVSSYSRLTKMREVAVWYSLVELPPDRKISDLVLRLRAKSSKKTGPKRSKIIRPDLGTPLKSYIAEVLVSLEEVASVEDFMIKSSHGLGIDIHRLCRDLEIDNGADSGPLLKLRIKEIKARPGGPQVEVQGKNGGTGGLGHSSGLALGATPFYEGKGWRRDEKAVFVAMPFAEGFGEFYSRTLKKTIENAGLRPIRTDQKPIPDTRIPLPDFFKEWIATCEFVVADVTGCNPNVLYEIGLAHAIGKRVLLICNIEYKNDFEKVFDLRWYLHLYYSENELTAFRGKLKRQLKALASGTAIIPESI